MKIEKAFTPPASKYLIGYRFEHDLTAVKLVMYAREYWTSVSPNIKAFINTHSRGFNQRTFQLHVYSANGTLFNCPSS